MKVSEFIKENKIIFLIYFISTLYLVYQHHAALLWDFSAYVLNAKYLFYGGTYFEVYRAPLAPILIGISLILSKFGEYLFIIFVSSLFLYANVKLSSFFFKSFPQDKRKFYQLVFYFFSLAPFVIIYATLEGTEMLGLAIFEIFILLITNVSISSFVFSLTGEGTLNANISSVSGIIARIPISFLGSMLWTFKKKLP